MTKRWWFGALVGLSLVPSLASAGEPAIKVGIIGLDTSHAIHFTEIMNDPGAKGALAAVEVVAAYPKGSRDIPSSVKRIPEYTKKMKGMGITIVGSIDALLDRVDAVMLETNDGRPHLRQARPVLRANKPLFIDKPIAGSLADAVAIVKAARKHETPIFSSSALRYAKGVQAAANGAQGRVVGCDAYSPAPLEETHPDLYWYGIHGVETLFTVMGPGCERVQRAATDGTDVVVGVWEDGRIGTFRGIREGQRGYGGTVFGTEGQGDLGGFTGYEGLVVDIARFFKSGEPPVRPEVTLEIYAFMTAADVSKRNGGEPVSIDKVLKRARREAQQ